MADPVGIKEFAEMRGVSEEYARQLVRMGKAPRHYKLGRKIVFERQDIIDWLKAQVVNPENK